MMPTFRVKFHFRRTLTCYIDAETEEDIDDFMVDNPTFSPLDDCPEMIEEDETGVDEDSEEGDYDIVLDESNVTPMFSITPGLQLVEIDE